MDRLAPNLAHMCRFIWEWINAKQIALRDTKRGHLRIFWGEAGKSLEKLSNGWTDWHQIWYTAADSSWNGQTKYNSPLNIPGGILGGFRGSQIQKYVESVKRMDRLAPNLVQMCGFVWEST